MSESTMTINEFGTKYWRNSSGHYHRTDGPAIEYKSGSKGWWLNGRYLGSNEKGFWNLWTLLSTEEKKDPVLLTYLPEKF